MAITVYSGTDTGAPEVARDAGTLISVFDACLVNGYGAKPAAGWTKEFSGTNKAVYRAPAGNQLYLRVDDTASYYSNVEVYETMSDVDTGTNPITRSTGTSWYKHTELSGHGDDIWTLIADDRGFYWFPADTIHSGPTRLLYYFGDFPSIEPTFNYNTVLFGSAEDRFGQYGASDMDAFASSCYVEKGSDHYLWRDETGNYGDSIHPRLSGFSTSTNSAENALGIVGVPYPSPVTGSMHLSKLLIYSTNAAGTATSIYGYMPGLYNSLHDVTTLGDFNINNFSGNGGLTGTDFIYLPFGEIKGGAGNPAGAAIVQTNGDWYA